MLPPCQQSLEKGAPPLGGEIWRRYMPPFLQQGTKEKPLFCFQSCEYRHKYLGKVKSSTEAGSSTIAIDPPFCFRYCLPGAWVGPESPWIYPNDNPPLITSPIPSSTTGSVSDRTRCDFNYACWFDKLGQPFCTSPDHGKTIRLNMNVEARKNLFDMSKSCSCDVSISKRPANTDSVNY